MARVLAIAAGGAVGALLTYWVSSGTHALLGWKHRSSQLTFSACRNSII